MRAGRSITALGRLVRPALQPSLEILRSPRLFWFAASREGPTRDSCEDTFWPPSDTATIYRGERKRAPSSKVWCTAGRRADERAASSVKARDGLAGGGRRARRGVREGSGLWSGLWSGLCSGFWSGWGSG